MNHELLAARVEQLTGRYGFTLAGRTYWLRPDVTLLDWMAALFEPAPDAVVPGLLDEGARTELYEALFDEFHPLDSELCRRIGLSLVEDAGGRPWWEVLRLVATGLEHWTIFDGWCAHEAGGLDPRSLGLDRFINLVHRFLLIGCADDTEREDYLARLTAPPENAAAELEDRPEWSDEGMAGGFEAAFAQFAASGAPGG